jgi:[protein-PII] uridylyltransferase
VAALPVADELPAVLVGEDRVSVTANDRRGLLAAIAGCLSLHRLDVVAADTLSTGGLAQMTCAVQARFGGDADPDALAADLRRAIAGELPVAERLAARERSQRRRAAPVPPRIVWHPATDAVVLEVRASDSPGLLFRVAHALEELGADVRAARISTLGGEVVDAFYLSGDWPAAERVNAETALLAAIAGPS